MFKFLEKFLDSNEKVIKKIQPIVDEINGLEDSFAKLSDEELKAKTIEFRNYIKSETASEQKELDDFKNELVALEAKLNNSSSEEERDSISNDMRSVQDNIKKAEQNLIDSERDVLDEILPQAFAAVREASKRTLGLRHYDVQLIGGVVLHRGEIAEMRTGEGKTLVATLAIYLNCLPSRGVHLVTVNDYLARRDPYWMGPVFEALGVTVASIYPMQDPSEQLPARLFDPTYNSNDPKDPWPHFKPIKRAEAYKADITYGTSAEFGFDYLRDNMAQDLKQLVQRPLYFAVVDEIDNLLIDEARTPLIISAPDAQSSRKYQIFARLVKSLHKDTDYEVKEKEQLVEPTDEGYAHVEQLLKREGLLEGSSLYDLANTDLMRHLQNALSAKELFHKDVEYIVKDGEIVIVDALTGRLMLGRRYSEGLHQAIEAKENVKVQNESKTYATITIQNYFRMYENLSGMTGTAETEAEEFSRIYELEVVVIPTNKPIQREDLTDLVYVDTKAKYKALVKEIDEIHKTGRPILIGTVSIEKNQELHELLNKKGIKHNILNAKNHLKEAEIVAEAGKEGAITLATNMAGRGVDIILGGKVPEIEEGETQDKFEKRMAEWQKAHDRVIELGGLYVLGTERHEARRIDNQLRGRAGRQGDPGTSRFFVALDDDIMRKFGGDRAQSIMNWAGMDENSPIENKMISKTIENSQVRVEGYHFDIRKHIVEYDDVINRQREVIYAERRKVLTGADLRSNILDMLNREIDLLVENAFNTDTPSVETIVTGMSHFVNDMTDITVDVLSNMNNDQIAAYLKEIVLKRYHEREESITPEVMRILERLIMLKTIDSLWVEHLTAVDYLRRSIGMQAVAQQDPLVAYKRTASEMFEDLTNAIQSNVAHSILKVNVVKREEGTNASAPIEQKPLESPMKQVMPNTDQVANKNKVGRNDPCPCGSGKKYKQCCGK